MITTAFKDFAEASATPPTLFPTSLHPENYAEVWARQPWARYFANTVFVAGATVFGEIVIAVLAAYAFAQMNFRGKNLLFALFLATYMMPGEATLIPNFVMMSKAPPGVNPLFPIPRLGLYDTYAAQILPFLASAFSVFLLRQQFLAIPKELHDAAKIDGAGHVRFLWSIATADLGPGARNGRRSCPSMPPGTPSSGRSSSRRTGDPPDPGRAQRLQRGSGVQLPSTHGGGVVRRCTDRSALSRRAALLGAGSRTNRHPWIAFTRISRARTLGVARMVEEVGRQS